MYTVKEIFYSLQGEGARAGRPAVFLRFSGCNLWNGREEDRHQAICKFCDTDFVGTTGTFGGKYQNANELASQVSSLWPKQEGIPYVVCTGGEPMLQLDVALIKAFHSQGFEVAIETNGTIELCEGIDWVCMSPKASTQIVVTKGNEIKVIYPQYGIDPKHFEDLDFKHFYIQPMDNEQQISNIRLAAEYCLQNPQWKLSLQMHKILGLR
jgi:7-carboxy-7-deazaguanine synthase